KGLKILGRAPKLVEDENGPEGARLHFAITRLRLLRQDWKRAINFGLKGISICQKISDDGPELGAFYQLVARAFYRKGDYSHAVDNFQRGLEAAEAHANRSLMVSILDDLGRVYLERGEYFRSARYLFKALEIRRNDVDVIGLSRSYDQLSLCYQRNGDYLRTIEYLNLSLRLKERIGDFEGLNPTLGNLGDLYWRLGQYTRAIAIFRREVENSQTLKATNQDETVWLVDSFIRLGRTYFEIGDLKRAEDYCKQALNLATEFKLRSQEADGRLLEGNLRAHERDWGPAEKSLRWAGEAYAKLGHRYREAAAILDLAAMKLAREQHDEALKLASRAQLIADEIKIMDLQVRALIVKGNVHRFLKGGNPEKVRENFSKALEISQNLSDVTILFLLFYSLAKVHHGERELTEAANYYGKAEAILKRIIDGLPENLASRFQEDRRRQVFAEDLMRFRKEAQSRSTVIDARERTLSGADLRDRPAGLADFKDLMARILRVDRAVGQLHFYEQLLSECVELAGADRGLLLRVQNREYLPVSFQGFGSEPTHHPEYPAASHLTEEAIRRGKTILHSGGDISQLGRFVHLETLTGRCIMAVPLMTDERIFGGVYLDKPAALGRFATREQTLVESFAEHAGIAFQNRRQLDIAIREPMTGFYTPNYFIDRLREAYRWYNLHGRSFSLIGYYVPVIESALGEGREGLGEELARAIAEVVPYRSAICWGNPVLYLLLSDVDLSSGAEEMAERVRAKLEDLLGEDVPHEIAVAERHYQQGAEIYFDLRRKLLPEEADQRTLFELRRLLASELTIKEAKGLLEKHIIERTLRKTHGNITHAARELGIHRPQLSNLLKKYRLKREVFEGPASRRMHPGDN
ncbi:MAG: tetratricopeptide repeat protein, partial [Planctomycetes bacterium]|nr:tetratricopeptide repeat protein [Planctomycetota bacterium]